MSVEKGNLLARYGKRVGKTPERSFGKLSRLLGEELIVRWVRSEL